MKICYKIINTWYLFVIIHYTFTFRFFQLQHSNTFFVWITQKTREFPFISDVYCRTIIIDGLYNANASSILGWTMFNYAWKKQEIIILLVESIHIHIVWQFKFICSCWFIPISVCRQFSWGGLIDCSHVDVNGSLLLPSISPEAYDWLVSIQCR